MRHGSAEAQFRYVATVIGALPVVRGQALSIHVPDVMVSPFLAAEHELAAARFQCAVAVVGARAIQASAPNWREFAGVLALASLVLMAQYAMVSPQHYRQRPVHARQQMAWPVVSILHNAAAEGGVFVPAPSGCLFPDVANR